MFIRRTWAMAVGCLLLGTAAAATIATIDEGPVAGRPSLAIGADGLPVIAYQTLTNRLRVARCLDIDCAASTAIDIGDPPSGMTTALHTAIAIAADGYPAIAFKDVVDNQLKLVKCTNIDCSGGSYVFRTIDPGPHDVGAYVSMAFDADGKAAFVYQDFNDQSLKLARCLNAGCGNVDLQVLDDSTATYGEYASIATDAAGELAVSQHWTNSAGDGAIKFMRCSGSPCSGTWEQLYYVSGHPVGSALSMALRADGRPVIAYQKELTTVGGGRALYVAECGDPDCHQANLRALDLQPGLDTGEDVSIAIGADGGTLIAYFDQSALKLKVAKCNAQGCFGPGDRLFADGFD